jgi:hypothetical protein
LKRSTAIFTAAAQQACDWLVKRAMTPERTVTTVAESGAIAPLSSLGQARDFARQSKVENTLRGYRTDWHDFDSCCESREFSPIPPGSEIVASYIAECAVVLKVGSIQRN